MYVSLCPPLACKPTHPVILRRTARAESDGGTNMCDGRQAQQSRQKRQHVSIRRSHSKCHDWGGSLTINVDLSASFAMVG